MLSSRTLLTLPTQAASFLISLPPLIASFMTSAPPSPRKKTPRALTEFGANRTASLALPTFKTPSKTAREPQSVSSLASLFGSFAALVITPRPEVPLIDESKQENVTKAMTRLQLTIKQSTDKKAIDKLILEQVNLVEEEIKEHAKRRVDLFFYTLISVYGQYLQIEMTPTVLQHGRGSAEYGTEACHSSLFPSLGFKRRTAWFDYIRQPLPLPTLSGTDFEHTLNMTVELPSVVNDFDQHLEGIKRTSHSAREALRILHEVSNCTITPIEGMNQFLRALQDFFNQMDTKYIQTTGKIDNPEAFKKVLELQRTGTFICAEPLSDTKKTHTIKEEYIHLMLRLNSSEIFWRNLPYRMDSYYCRIQEEILKPLPEEKIRPASPRRPG